MTKIIMICAPARSGKDTLYPIFRDDCIKRFGGRWSSYAFADKLKADCKEYIYQTYGLDVWEDKDKHVFRPHLIEYGKKRRDETNGMYLIDAFLDELERSRKKDRQQNFIITDFRFINEYDVINKIGQEIGFDVHPVYVERYVQVGAHKFTLQPTIPVEVENYGPIREISTLNQIEWQTGWFWKRKLKRKVSIKL
jgi:hypothetical protein